MARRYELKERAASVERNRRAILDAAWDLIAEAGFHPVSLEVVAARAGVTRVTIYRQFGSKTGLFEAVLWDRLSRARLDRLDRARQRPDPVDALEAFLYENCRLFTEVGDALQHSLGVARSDTTVRDLLDISYFGRRVDSIRDLVRRLHDGGRLAPGWTQDRAVDALVVLTSIEAFDSLTRRRGRSVRRAADTLFAMAGAFLAP